MKSYLLKITQTLLLVIVCLISGILIEGNATFLVSNNVHNQSVIIIDPGHGGLTNTID